MSKSSGLVSVREFQGTRIQVAALREVGPVPGSPPEGDVAGVNAARQRVLLAGLRYDFAAGLSQGLQQRVVEFADLDGLVLSELFQGLGVVGVEFRERQRVLRIRHRRYRVAVVGAQPVPQLLVDASRNPAA